MKLSENRQAKAIIIISEKEWENKESPVRFASRELRYYLDRITLASFDISTDESVAPSAQKDEAPDEKCRIELTYTEEYGPDGFSVNCDGKKIEIAGGKRGILYGVYDFLETLGCRFFTQDCEKIPVDMELNVPEMHFTKKPAFEYREHNYSSVTENPKFAAKCRFNGSLHKQPKCLGGNISYAIFVHSFETLVPTSVYGKTHPEYFSLIDGNRRVTPNGTTQLCLTNPDVLKIAIESTRKILKENPDAGIISVSQNDWHDNCQCENCRKTDEEEGSPSGTLLRFVNAMAEALEPEFPNVIFDTLAYLYTRPAPKVTRNRKNVCVRLCTIECCFSHPFETCTDTSRGVKHPDGTTTMLVDDLRAWAKVCDRMYIWDYTTCFAHYPTPHPNWPVLQPNVQTMFKNNVKGVFEQANGASKGGVDFNELRLYLISKLLWDPFCDIEKHRKEFLEYYYGAAAPFLDEYLNLLCDTCEKLNCHVGFNDNPLHGFLNEENLSKYNELFDRAAEAVKGDALRLFRVEKNRLSIRWVGLKRKAMLENKFDAEEVNRFFSDWQQYGLSRIDEWCNIDTTYRAFVDNIWRGIDYFEHFTLEEPELF